MTLTIDAQTVSCTNINLRRENEGDDHVTAVYIKIEANAPAKIADQLTGRDISNLLWTKAGEPTYPGISHIDLRAEFENHSCDLQGIGLEHCKLNKFAFEPTIGHTMKLGFRIQARPDKDQLSALTDLIKEDFVLGVYGEQELPLEATGTGE